VVMAWTADDSDVPHATSPGEQREAAMAVLARTIKTVSLPAGVSVASEAVQGRAAEVLAAAAHDGDLLVVGSHGHGRLYHSALGSVSDACVCKAGCPVVVVPVPHQLSEPARDPAVPV
jgi:nucleotide-binding universal stress UspA family protein